MSNPVSRIKDLFDVEVETYGKDPRACYWRSAAGQWLRFEIMTFQFEPDLLANPVCAVLDVGCGQADLLEHLDAGGFEGQYFGIDVSPKMIAICKNRIETDFKDMKIRPIFQCADFMQVEINPNAHDYVFASGIWNMRVWSENGIATLYAQKTIEKMFTIASRGIAYNMLSVLGDWYNARNHYYKPIEMLSHALRLGTRRVIFRHDYAPHDFTIIVRKEGFPRRQQKK